MADIFVILYPQEPYNVVAPQRYLYTRTLADDNSTLLTQPETNTHFIAKYQAPPYPPFRFNHRDVETGNPPQPETNVHFIGKYQLPVYRNLPWLSNAVVSDLPPNAIPQNAQAQPFVILYEYQVYNVVKPGRLFYFQQDVPFQLPPALQPETNPHFVGRFTPSGYTFFSSSEDTTQTSVPPQPETNTHFIGKYQPTRYQLPNYFIPDYPFQPPPPVQETNTHFIARYRPSVYARPVNAWDTAVQAPLVQPETNQHFIGRFTPTKLRLWPWMYQNSALDVPVAPPPPPPPAQVVAGVLGSFGKDDLAISPPFRVDFSRGKPGFRKPRR